MNGAVNKALIEKVVYPAMERFKHNRIRTYCGELQRTQFLPPAELRALQAERLRRLLLESLDGREDAMFQLPDGRLVYGSFLCRLSNRYPAIRQFQIVQESPERAVCSVVLWDQREDEAAAFARDIADFLPGVRVALRVVAEIAPEPSGKHRYAVRKFERRRIDAQ